MIEVWRSNYFKVRDRSAFQAWLQAFPEAIDLKIASPDNPHSLVAIIQSSESDRGIPMDRILPDYSIETINFFQELATHLADGQVAVLIEIAHDDQRYVTGNAIAVHSNGETLMLSLQNIYDQIRNHWNLETTLAED